MTTLPSCTQREQWNRFCASHLLHPHSPSVVVKEREADRKERAWELTEDIWVRVRAGFGIWC